MRLLDKNLFLCLSLIMLFGIKLVAERNEHIKALVMVDSGSNLKNSVKRDAKLMTETLQAVSNETEMELHLTLLQGYDVTPDKIYNWIESLRTTHDNDVVLFYFSGHGCKDSARVPWPCLFFSTKRRFIALQEIIKQVESLSSRLSLVVADCCNGSMAAKEMLPYQIQSVSVGVPPLPKGALALFKNIHGHIRLTAAVPGQNALAYKEGSLFTMALNKALLRAFKKTTPSWKGVMRTTKFLCGTLQKPYMSIEVE